MEKVIVLVIIGLIILLLNIPLLSSHSALFNNIYQYLVSSTGNNKDYFQVVFSAVAILTTYLVFNLQRVRERRIQEEESIKDRENELVKENEKQEQFFAEREMELSQVRPLFMINKLENEYEIELFMKGKEPLTNIKIYSKLIEGDFDEIRPTLFGNATRGDILFKFDPLETEMFLVSCMTFLDERIYFVYYIGDSMLHFREVTLLGEFEYSKQNLNRTSLSEASGNELDKYIELYKSQVKYDYLKDLPQLMFSQMLHRGFFKDYLSINESPNYGLKLVLAMQQESIGQIFSESIRFVRDYTKMDIDALGQFIDVLIKYLSDSWYLTTNNIEEDKYYFSNKVTFNKQDLQEYYSNFFLQEEITKDAMIEYMKSLKKDIVEFQNVNEYFLRVLEVYFRDHVQLADGRKDSNIEKETVFSYIRQDLRRTLLNFTTK